MKGCKSQSERYFANEDWRHRNSLFCPNFRYISNCLCRKCNCNFCTEMKRIVFISSFFLQFDHLVDTPSIRNHRGTKINGLLTANLLANSRTHGVQGLTDWKLLAALSCIVGENEAVTSSFLLYILFPRLTNSRPTIGNLASNGTKDQMVTLTFHFQLAIFSSTTSCTISLLFQAMATE